MVSTAPIPTPSAKSEAGPSKPSNSTQPSSNPAFGPESIKLSEAPNFSILTKFLNPNKKYALQVQVTYLANNAREEPRHAALLIREIVPREKLHHKAEQEFRKLVSSSPHTVTDVFVLFDTNFPLDDTNRFLVRIERRRYSEHRRRGIEKVLMEIQDHSITGHDDIKTLVDVLRQIPAPKPISEGGDGGCFLFLIDTVRALQRAGLVSRSKLDGAERELTKHLRRWTAITAEREREKVEKAGGRRKSGRRARSRVYQWGNG